MVVKDGDCHPMGSIFFQSWRHSELQISHITCGMFPEIWIYGCTPTCLRPVSDFKKWTILLMWIKKPPWTTWGTVDGRNPAPVDKMLISSFFPLFKRISTSQVVQDCFHQKYVTTWGTKCKSTLHSNIIHFTNYTPVNEHNNGKSSFVLVNTITGWWFQSIWKI